MIKILRSLPDANALRQVVENECAMRFDDFTLYRDIGGAVYFAKSSARRYVFKLSIAPYSEKAMRAVRVINYAVQRGFPAAPVVPTRTGESFITVEMPEGERIGALFAHVEGSPATHEDIYGIGKLTGRLHSLLHAYKDTDALPTAFTKESCIDLLPVEARKASYDRDSVNELEEYGRILWARVKDESPGVVHGDLDVGNILRQPSGALAFIDFDDVASAPLAYDAASICSRINYMAVTQQDIEATRRAVEQFNAGYREERSAVFDVQNVFNFIAVKRFEAQGQALRRVMPVVGNQNFLRFMDATRQWFADWKRMFG